MYSGPYEIVPGHYAEVNEADGGEGCKGMRGREEERKDGFTHLFTSSPLHLFTSSPLHLFTSSPLPFISS
jgi:hypothetical protein